MRRKIQLLLLGVLTLALFTGCAGFDPYALPVEIGFDDLQAPQAEKPTQQELRNDLRTIVVLPTRAAAELNVLALHTRMRPVISSVLKATGRLEVISNGNDYEAALRQIAAAHEDLYSPAGAAMLAKLLRVTHVGWLTVHSFDAALEDQIQRKRKELLYVEYVSAGSASLSLTIMDALSGQIIIEEGASATVNLKGEARPSLADLNRLAEDAAVAAVERFAPYIVPAFPLWGYIAELRGGRTVALVRFSATTDIRVGTLIHVMQKSSSRDPVSAEMRTRYQEIGTLRVRQIDSNGIWCQTDSGAENIRLGHPVVTGKLGSAFFW